MSARVYIGGLHPSTNEDDLDYLLRKYGRLREISLKRGFAFVEFDDFRSADDACNDLNGVNFKGERIRVDIARGTPHGRDRDRWGGRGERRDEHMYSNSNSNPGYNEKELDRREYEYSNSRNVPRKSSPSFNYPREERGQYSREERGQYPREERGQYPREERDRYHKESRDNFPRGGHYENRAEELPPKPVPRYGSYGRNEKPWQSNRYGPPIRFENRLIVQNLSSDISWQDLKDFMRKAGDVIYANAHSKFKNEGVVQFADNKGLKNAIYMFDDIELRGRHIRLIEEGSERPRYPKEQRSRSRPRSREKRPWQDGGRNGTDRDRTSREDSYSDMEPKRMKRHCSPDVKAVESWISSSSPMVKKENIKEEPMDSNEDYLKNQRRHRDINMNELHKENQENYDDYYN